MFRLFYLLLGVMPLSHACTSNGSSSSVDDLNFDNLVAKTSDRSNVEPPKQISWANGNIYSYDFVETIFKVDSLGNKTAITVYKSNPPGDREIVCDTKVCEWCSKEVQAKTYEIEEYPNIDWLRGEPSIASIVGALSMVFEGKKYYDLDHNRIRTEWRVNCSYPGPDGFCSRKCENEYKYSE